MALKPPSGANDPVGLWSAVNVMDYGARADGTTDDTDAIQMAIDAAVGIQGSLGQTVYLPEGTYRISSPLWLRNVTLRGDHRGTVLKALSGFSGKHMVRNWQDSETTPSTFEPPATTAFPHYYCHIEDVMFDFGGVTGLTGIAWVHIQETSVLRNLIFTGGVAGGDYVGIYLPSNSDPFGGIAGQVTIDGVTCYGAGWQTELLVDADGGGIKVGGWTTSPSAHSGSVFDTTDSGALTFESCHVEAWVDPTLVADTDLAVFRVRDANGLGLVNCTLAWPNASLTHQHPAIYTTNSSGSGNDMSSPQLVNCLFHTAAGVSWASGKPVIKDRSQSGWPLDIYNDDLGPIFYFDGNIFSYMRAGGVGKARLLRPSVARARVYRQTDQSIPDTTPTAIQFPDVEYDSEGLWDSGSNTRLTAPYAGTWRLVGNVAFDASATGYRTVGIRVNGTTFAARVSETNPGATGFVELQAVAECRLAAGGYAELVVVQTSGGSLASKATTPVTPHFSMSLVSDYDATAYPES